MKDSRIDGALVIASGVVMWVLLLCGQYTVFLSAVVTTLGLALIPMAVVAVFPVLLLTSWGKNDHR